MTSKCGKNKEVAHEPQASVSLNLFVKEIEKGIRQLGNRYLELPRVINRRFYGETSVGSHNFASQ